VQRCVLWQVLRLRDSLRRITPLRMTGLGWWLSWLNLDGEGFFDGDGDAVIVVVRGDEPVASVCESKKVGGSIGHEDCTAGGFEHGDVVPVVADGEDFGHLDTAQRGEAGERSGLGAAGGEDVQDGEIAVWIRCAMQRDLSVGKLGRADGGDARVCRECGFGSIHTRDGAAEHHLDWFGGVERVLDGRDLREVIAIGIHPAADGGVEFVVALADEGAAGVVAAGADGVKGEHERGAKLVSVRDEPAGGFQRKVAAMQQLRTDGADDRAVGADERMLGGQIEFPEDLQGKAMAATGGHDDLNASGVGECDSGTVALGDVASRVEQGAVEVDGDEARL